MDLNIEQLNDMFPGVWEAVVKEIERQGAPTEIAEAYANDFYFFVSNGKLYILSPIVNTDAWVWSGRGLVSKPWNEVDALTPKED